MSLSPKKPTPSSQASDASPTRAFDVSPTRAFTTSPSRTSTSASTSTDQLKQKINKWTKLQQEHERQERKPDVITPEEPIPLNYDLVGSERPELQDSTKTETLPVSNFLIKTLL